MRQRPISGCAAERERSAHREMTPSHNQVTKTKKEAPPSPQEARGGLGLILILTMTAIGVGYVAYWLTLVFGVIGH